LTMDGKGCIERGNHGYKGCIAGVAKGRKGRMAGGLQSVQTKGWWGAPGCMVGGFLDKGRKGPWCLVARDIRATWQGVARGAGYVCQEVVIGVRQGAARGQGAYGKGWRGVQGRMARGGKKRMSWGGQAARDAY
jgi:hypothetical protein